MENKKTLATEYPNIAKEWHPTKNGKITPSEVAPKSGKMFWWVGACGHEWQAKVYARTNGHGCPYCSGNKILPGFNDLASTNPAVSKEWHPSKNGDLKPTMVASSSNKKVWWLGKCGHEWQAVIEGRTAGNGCPICANQKVLKGFNDLATANPELASEWHPTKNGNLTPDMVTVQAQKRVWWLGKCGHEWQATIAHRSNNRGCPYCSNKKVLVGYNDLSTTNPVLAKEWNTVKNNGVLPIDITAGSHKKFWWKCNKGHEWQATVKDRQSGTGCPICSSRIVVCGENDLATIFPNLAQEWHPTKNGKLLPNMFAPFSAEKVWWICDRGHVWKAAISSRSSGRGCPICAKEYQTSFPEQAIYYYVKQAYPDAINSDRTSIGIELDIFIPSIKAAIEYDGYNWHKDSKSEAKKNALCKDNGITLIRIREEGLVLYDDCICIVRNNCKSNTDLNKCIERVFDFFSNPALIDINVDRDESKIHENYIVTQKERSLAKVSPLIAAEWHPLKNGRLSPEMVSFGSKKRIWWLGKCGHEWQATIDSRVKGNGCPICANQRILVGYNDLETTAPEIAKDWHPTKNGSLKPTEVTRFSNKKIWWHCEKGHDWQTSVAVRSAGRGCPYCSNKKILSGFNDLQTINPVLADEWHPTKNGDLLPSQVAPKSGKKVWWLCKHGHEWQAKVNDRANGTGCPICRKNKKTN